MSDLQILIGDCRETLKQLPDQSVQTCITSPPYFGLRDYGTGTWNGGDPSCSHKRDSKYSDKTITGHANKELVVGDEIYKSVCPRCGAVRKDNQIGLEQTPQEFVDQLVSVFREVKRVLRDDGTLWLNLGDSYSSYKDGKATPDTTRGEDTGTLVDKGLAKNRMASTFTGTRIKNKDLIGIPWMVAFALRSDGWYLRQDIIWHKPNPMPESVEDRCTKSHEYIFLMSKSPKYYFDHDAIKEKAISEGKFNGSTGMKSGANGDRTDKGRGGIEGDGTRNKRSVWSVNVAPFKGAHFATFPEELIQPCILAGSKAGDVVLDPFGGSGTTGKVSLEYGRKAILCELNPEYVKIIEQRTNVTIGFQF